MQVLIDGVFGMQRADTHDTMKPKTPMDLIHPNQIKHHAGHHLAYTQGNMYPALHASTLKLPY